jgi:hypothetical protein
MPDANGGSRFLFIITDDLAFQSAGPLVLCCKRAPEAELVHDARIISLLLTPVIQTCQ